MTGRLQRPTMASAIGQNRRRVENLENALDPASYEIKLYSEEQTVETGDGQFIWMIPRELDGRLITEVAAFVSTVSSSGDLTIQLANLTTVLDILSTPVTIEAGDFTSYPAAVQSVVDETDIPPPTNMVSIGDLLSIDVDAAGTGAKGLGVAVTLA